MELSEIIPHIEALIFASEKPVTSLEITELINNAFGFMEDKITLDQVESALEGVIEKYGSGFYPFEVRESGGGWQFLTKKEFHKTVAQLNGDKYLKRLSNAALETLSIIAYKQPVTKGEIEAIRGVSSDYSIQKLLEKELVLITGRNEDMPGKPLVYATSKNFMDYFGLNSPQDLPEIKDILANQIVEPTTLTGDELQPDTFPDKEDDGNDLNLVVGEDGALEEREEPESLNGENNPDEEHDAETDDTGDTGAGEATNDSGDDDTDTADNDNGDFDTDADETDSDESGDLDDDNADEENDSDGDSDDEDEQDDSDDDDDDDDSEDDDENKGDDEQP